MDNHELCAWPQLQHVSFSPRECSNTSARCAADRAAIRDCPLYLGYGSHLQQKQDMQQLLIAALSGSSIAIVGDSMARQAFVVLVARMRGLDWSLDFNVHQDVQYFSFHNASMVVGALDLAHLPLPQLGAADLTQKAATPALQHQALNAITWAAQHAGLDVSARAAAKHVTLDTAARQLASSHIRYIWAPCSYWMQEAAKQLQSTRVSFVARVFLFVPAYWHLTGACGNTLNATRLNATRESIMAMWMPWLTTASSRTNYTVVTAPIENVPISLKPTLRRYNVALANLFAAGEFPSNWKLFDWAILMEKQQPATVYLGEHAAASWHYSCQYRRGASWYTLNYRHNVSVITQASGECGEGGSTTLWDHLLIGGRDARGRAERS